MDLASLVARGLRGRPRSLPPVLFYDAAGSALFDEITRTPEYYLTRTERSILEARATEILRAANGHGPLEVVELGAGSAEKTRIILQRLVAHQGDSTYVPIDVSRAALVPAARAIESEIAGLRVRPIVGDNEASLAKLPANGPARLVLFLGSSIGNMEHDVAAAFLAQVARRMRPQDRLLLGADLVKDKIILEAAYNDAAGVTARFNLNALARLNADFGADFDLDAFAHRAFYNEADRRIEMHLDSLRDQRVTIPKLDVAFDIARGDSIHTENSYKYTSEDVARLADASGLRKLHAWRDPRERFALHLLARSDA